MKNRPLCSICLIFFLLMCVGIHMGKDEPSPAGQYIVDGEEILLAGQVYNKESKEKYQILYLKNNSIECQGKSLKESKTMIYDEEKTKIQIGQKLQVKGKASFFEPAYNPGNFDRKAYYERQNIYVSVWADQIEITDAGKSLFFDGLYDFRQRRRATFTKYMPEEDGAVLSAMLLGEKGDVDGELKELYQTAGIGHVLAISGLHLSFIGVGLYQFLRKRSGSFVVGGVGGITFLLLYVFMIGFTISAMRALVMFLFRVGADITGRHYDSPTALSAAAVIVLLWRPLSVYDGGFWLSFGAVAAVILIFPFFSGFPFQGFWASVSINLMLFPVILYYFYEFPVYSILLNLIVIPLMSAILFLGILGSVLSGLTGFPGVLAFQLCTLILGIYEKGSEVMLSLPGARFIAGRPHIWQIAAYYLCLVTAMLVWKHYKYRVELSERKEEDPGKRNYIVYMLVLLGIGGFLLSHRFGELEKLYVTVLDVGQGDGIFMRGPQGSTYFIDGGSSDVKNVGKYRIEPFLKSQGVEKLDYVFISHGDSDHISGILEMMDRELVGIEIGMLILPSEVVWDDALKELAAVAMEHNVRVSVIETGQEVREGELHISCIHPGENYEGESGNAASMVLAVNYGDFDMLFTGDVEEEGEEMLIRKLEERYGTKRWDVLKVAHHGSKNSSTEPFVEKTRPVYTVISAGKENRYGHPHEETLERLKDAGSEVYCTKESGAIIVETDGEKMQVTEFS